MGTGSIDFAAIISTIRVNSSFLSMEAKMEAGSSGIQTRSKTPAEESRAFSFQKILTGALSGTYTYED